MGTLLALHYDSVPFFTLTFFTPLFWFSSYSAGQMLLSKETSRKCASGTEPLPSSNLSAKKEKRTEKMPLGHQVWLPVAEVKKYYIMVVINLSSSILKPASLSSFSC